MASFNKVILIGNMAADPELKQTNSGTSVCSFRIAVNRRFAKADQGQQTRSWTDNQGQKRNTVEVVADEATFVASAAQTAAASSSHESQGNSYTPNAYGAPAFNNTQNSNFEEIPGDESLPF